MQMFRTDSSGFVETSWIPEQEKTCDGLELCSFLVYELSSEVVHPVLCLCVL